MITTFCNLPPATPFRPRSFLFSNGSLGFNSTASHFFGAIFRTSNTSLYLHQKPPRKSLAIRAAGTDYYSTLKVGRNATLQEIKSSYRKLARKVRFALMPICLFPWMGKVKKIVHYCHFLAGDLDKISSFVR